MPEDKDNENKPREPVKDAHLFNFDLYRLERGKDNEPIDSQIVDEYTEDFTRGIKAELKKEGTPLNEKYVKIFFEQLKSKGYKSPEEVEAAMAKASEGKKDIIILYEKLLARQGAELTAERGHNETMRGSYEQSEELSKKTIKILKDGQALNEDNQKLLGEEQKRSERLLAEKESLVGDKERLIGDKERLVSENKSLRKEIEYMRPDSDPVSPDGMLDEDLYDQKREDAIWDAWDKIYDALEQIEKLPEVTDYSPKLAALKEHAKRAKEMVGEKAAPAGDAKSTSAEEMAELMKDPSKLTDWLGENVSEKVMNAATNEEKVEAADRITKGYQTLRGLEGDENAMIEAQINLKHAEDALTAGNMVAVNFYLNDADNYMKPLKQRAPGEEAPAELPLDRKIAREHKKADADIKKLQDILKTYGADDPELDATRNQLDDALKHYAKEDYGHASLSACLGLSRVSTVKTKKTAPEAEKLGANETQFEAVNDDEAATIEMSPEEKRIVENITKLKSALDTYDESDARVYGSRRYLKEAEEQYRAGNYASASMSALQGLSKVDTKRPKKKAPEKKPEEKDLLAEIEEKEKNGDK